jgi:hypothetical protein
VYRIAESHYHSSRSGHMIAFVLVDRFVSLELGSFLAVEHKYGVYVVLEEVS